MLKEFREFALRGNVIDMGVGIIIGAAFGKIVTSFVSDLLMPPIGMLMGRMDFSNLYIGLSGGNYASLFEAKAAGAATLNYGLFLNNIIDFAFVAFALFLLIRWVNKLKGPVSEPVPPVPVAMRECPECLSMVPEKARRCAHCTVELQGR
jgi:large conductance mechanosensitive channel